ncbi:MAG: GNAT family N-acetyltransferase [Gammaproteobacteria bacterium]|nr:GNAT family N-acetyltransferase [Gammaproteobacteria bacterium]
MKVRAVNLADKPAWLGMRRRLRPGEDEAIQERDWRRVIEQRAEHAALLALGDDDAVIGVIEVSRRAPRPGSAAGAAGHIDLLHIEQGHPREAVARRLLDAAAAWAQSRGCRELATEIDTDNHWDQKLTEQLGFEVVSRYVRYRRFIEPAAASVETNDTSVPAPPHMPPEVAVLPVAPAKPVRQPLDEPDEDEDAPNALAHWRARAPHVVLCVLGLVGFYFTDIWGGGVFTGVVLPFVDVIFVIYVLTLIVMIKYRRRTDTDDRALSLFDAVKNHDAPHQER